MPPRKDIKRVVKRLKKKKVTIKTKTKKKAAHICVMAPGGPVFCSSTPSDVRAIKNLVSMLKRKGVKL